MGFACASAGAGGSRAREVREAMRMPAAQRVRRVSAGAGGSRPQQTRSGNRAGAEPMPLLTPGAVVVSENIRRPTPADSGRRTGTGEKPSRTDGGNSDKPSDSRQYGYPRPETRDLF